MATETLIIMAGEHTLVSGDRIVPPIEAQLGRNWQQPSTSNISFEIDDVKEEDTVPYLIEAPVIHRCFMSEATMNRLKEYSTTTPSGVYPGKMWRGHYPDGWYLHWYGEVPGDPGMCRVYSAVIMLHELLQLLNPTSQPDQGD